VGDIVSQGRASWQPSGGVSKGKGGHPWRQQLQPMQPLSMDSDAPNEASMENSLVGGACPGVHLHQEKLLEGQAEPSKEGATSALGR